MKLIEPGYKIIKQEDNSLVGIKKFIERCARVSYKSEDKITDDSYEKFVDMLIKRGHYRPLEFGTVYLNFNELDQTELFQRFLYKEAEAKYSSNQWSRWNDGFCTTNYRVIIENGWEKDLEYIDKFPGTDYSHRYTVHFVIDRGVMDEFRTHIGLSHIAESTRFCSYDKDKFDNQVSFIIPEYATDLVNWTLDGELNYDVMLKLDEMGRPITKLMPLADELMAGLMWAEQTYLRMIKKGATPQQARSVLPLQTKSELISCGYWREWDNFFKLRTDKSAHPEARRITVPLEKELHQLMIDIEIV